MRMSREKTLESRARIVEAAARLFRESGIAATGVDAVMRAAGMTHGGFYKHFPSKEALVAEAMAHALDGTFAAQAEFGSLDALVSAYLSAEHRDAAGDGCAIAALGAEVARSDAGARRALTENVRRQAERLEALLPQQPGDRRARALVTLAAMVGGLVLARAVDDPDLSDAVLEATRKELAG